MLKKRGRSARGDCHRDSDVSLLSHTHRVSMMPLIQPMGWSLTLRLRRDGQIDLRILDSQKLRCQKRKDNQSVADTLCRPLKSHSYLHHLQKRTQPTSSTPTRAKSESLSPAPASNLGQAFLCFGDDGSWLDTQFLTVVFSYFYFGLLFLVVCP